MTALDDRPVNRRARWRDAAACLDSDPAIFDPLTGRGNQGELLDRRTAAQMLCATCPALASCAIDADDHMDVGLRAGSLRRHDQITGYVVEPLIGNAPPTRHVQIDAA